MFAGENESCLAGESEPCLADERELCLQVKKRKETWYKGLEFPVTSVLQKIENLQQQLSLAIQGRKWTEREGLIMRRHDLAKFFQEHVRFPVSSTYCAQQVVSVDIKCSMLRAVSVTVGREKRGGGGEQGWLLLC